MEPQEEGQQTQEGQPQEEQQQEQYQQQVGLVGKDMKNGGKKTELRREQRKMIQTRKAEEKKKNAVYGAILATTRSDEGFPLVTGNQLTCLPDAVLHAVLLLGWLGSIAKDRFRTLAVPQLGNDRQASWSTCTQALLQLVIPFELVRVLSKFLVEGGPMLALLREKTKVFVVGLEVLVGGSTNRHCVAFSASKRTLLDNHSLSKPVRVETADVRSKDTAHKVFRLLVGQRLRKGVVFHVNVLDIYELRSTVIENIG
jgi:hypothetical protein